MDKYSKCILGQFSGETEIALTVTCLNKEYPNVQFEACETGNGRYELTVVSRHGRVINDRELHTFKNISWVLYKSIPVILSEIDRY